MVRAFGLWICLGFVFSPLSVFAEKKEETTFEGDIFPDVVKEEIIKDITLSFSQSNVDAVSLQCEYVLHGFGRNYAYLPTHTLAYENKVYEFGSVESCQKTRDFFKMISQGSRTSITLTVDVRKSFIKLVNVKK